MREGERAFPAGEAVLEEFGCGLDAAAAAKEALRREQARPPLRLPQALPDHLRPFRFYKFYLDC